MEEEKFSNVVVFGANSLLGQDLMELFNYEENCYIRGYTKVECNITDEEDLFDVLGGTKGSITHLINCAAYTDINRAESEEEKAYNVNDKAIQKLAKICLDNHIHFTHISCCNVFEGLASKPYLEQSEKFTQLLSLPLLGPLLIYFTLCLSQLSFMSSKRATLKINKHVLPLWFFCFPRISLKSL